MDRHRTMNFPLEEYHQSLMFVPRIDLTEETSLHDCIRNSKKKNNKSTPVILLGRLFSVTKVLH